MPSCSSALPGSCSRPFSYVSSALSYSFMKNCRWPLRLRRCRVAQHSRIATRDIPCFGGRPCTIRRQQMQAGTDAAQRMFYFQSFNKIRPITRSALHPPVRRRGGRAPVALGERGREPDALVGVLDAVAPGAQLGVAGRAVAEQLVRLRVDVRRPARERLGVVLDRIGVLLALERLPARHTPGYYWPWKGLRPRHTSGYCWPSNACRRRTPGHSPAPTGSRTSAAGLAQMPASSPRHAHTTARHLGKSVEKWDALIQGRPAPRAAILCTARARQCAAAAPATRTKSACQAARPAARQHAAGALARHVPGDDGLTSTLP